MVKRSIIFIFLLVSTDVFLLESPAEALTCFDIIPTVMQCASFALGMVSRPSSQCCNELSRLHGMARTTDDRRQACNCLKQIAPQYPGAMDANLLALPQLCRVALAYPIRRDADCSK
ncbi:Non-specific lipid-transfer protein [Sesamum angolense]|uniref:Non-specific lipid-transfer protein n=1 Tax=Sesamum angolense TaxID=2727404 RepID=A0AAE1W5M9_9LAMI|nr:Non-specific lipid-transfer protein [Sesamum angolense]